jgi:predicted GTPase
VAERTRVIIMGAAGRDFHDFNVVFRQRADVEVVAFTAAQIPDIAGRTYPAELAGRLYPRGIPIHPESELERLIVLHDVHEVVFSYSDVSHEHVMHEAARANACDAGFRLLGPRATMLESRRPVVSVCAVRTGCGKSVVSRRVAAILRAAGLRVAVVRHPMPYGDLARQAAQRFASIEDLARHRCTIEEMEEYEPHLLAGGVVFAGVDYERILRMAEEESDAIVWDGGNNDVPFFVPDVEIVLVDPHRAGHETTYWPGEANLLRAHVLVVAKVDTARPDDVAAVRRAIARANPEARVIEAAMPIAVDDEPLVRGRRVLVIEDGPTVTHGGMEAGAGLLLARRLGAVPVDPRPFATGTIAAAYRDHARLGPVLPALGYSSGQLAELEETIARVPCDVVLVATPIDLGRVVTIAKPVARVRYDLEARAAEALADSLRPVIAAASGRSVA